MRAVSLIAIVTTLLYLSCGTGGQPLFVKVDSSWSNLNFENKVFESDTLNLAHNYYFYNGAGVTVCDFNNDNLEDIFLIGNHVSSRLYLNRGDFKFEEVTQQAGLIFDHWASGATFVDINGDHLQDIFISTVGKGDPNLLYINKGIRDGIPYFENETVQYGLHQEVISTQAAFFDFDRDHDLDLFIAVNSQLMNNRNETRVRNLDEFNYTNDKFYINNGDNTFSDISESAGITNEGYSLGVAINDINNDGWPDIYVANDFISNDLIYINNQNGGFIEKAADYLKHSSQNGMGVDIADVNRDGLMDITVVDMMPKSNRRRKLMLSPINYDLYEYRSKLGYIPQHIRNTLQLNTGYDNNGNITFSEVSCLAGIYSTDWSWAPLWADFDNDALLDLYITNGYYKDLTDLDFSLGLEKNRQFGTEEAIRSKERQDLSNLRPIKESNYFYRNDGKISMKDITKEVGLHEPSFSHGSAYADFDNDGDLDLIVNNLGHEAFLYKNSSNNQSSETSIHHYLKLKLNGPHGNTNGIGTRVTLVNKEGKQSYFHSNVRGYLSSMGEVIHFGLGQQKVVDSLFIRWSDGSLQVIEDISSDQTLIINYLDAKLQKASNLNAADPLFEDVTKSLKIEYTHKENKYIDFKDNPLFLKMYSKSGPALAIGDLNGDDEDDLVIGGAIGQSPTLFIQQHGKYVMQPFALADSLHEDTGILLFDIDNDADNDVYIVSGGIEHEEKSNYYQDRVYINDGGAFIRSDVLPDIKTSGGVVRGSDFDKDGDIDLFIGGKISPSQYPESPRSFLLQNQNGKLVDATPEAIKTIGMINDALWTDFNHDGWMDLIAVGEWTEIQFFINKSGKLIKYNESGLSHTAGWWNSIAAGDFDMDGDLDYIIGNQGENSYLTARPHHPIRMHKGDFDENGKLDPILSYYTENDQGKKEEFSVHTRDALIDQIVGYKRRFKDYKSFAEAGFSDILKSHDKKNTEVLVSHTLSTSYIENLGNGKFSLTPLPEEAQVSVVYGLSVSDTNSDGNLDVILTGNQNSAEPIFGNLDASTGLYMAGDGKGGFSYISSPNSGLHLNDAQRSIATARVDEQMMAFTTANSGPLRVIKYDTEESTDQQIINLDQLDEYAIIVFSDGRKIRREFYFGHGYLSQSSRSLTLTQDMVVVDIYNARGELNKVR